MPYVVMDTSISLPATLSAAGMARKLWLLLALGALTYQIEHHRLALEALARLAVLLRLLHEDVEVEPLGP